MAHYDTAASGQKFTKNRKPHKMRGDMKEVHRAGDEGSVPFCPGEMGCEKAVNTRTSHEMAKRFSRRKHR